MAEIQDTMTAALNRAAQEVPDRPFADILGQTFAFGEFNAAATEIAHGLAAAGVKRGDPVSCMLDNGPEILFLWFAVNKLGAIFAPVNTAFKGGFLEAQLNDTGADIVVTQAEHVGRITEVLTQTPCIKSVYVVGSSERTGVGPVRYAPFEDLRTGDLTPIPDETTPDLPALIIYTSGTTGPSKGCVIPHNMMCNSSNKSKAALGFRTDEVLWNCLPLFHANCMVTVMMAIIRQVRLAIGGRFSVSNFWPEIERTGATSVNLLGSMQNLIATAPDNDASRRCFGQIKSLLAVPFSKADAEVWERRFGVTPKGVSGFGMTEALSIAGTLPGEVAPIGSAGHGGIDFDVQLVDDNDFPVAVGAVGEIVCRPRRPNILFKGYWKRPEATVEAWRNLWFHTGDLARFDEQGWMYFVDRKKDSIRRRGENISTVEVERIFMNHGGLQDVAVHAVRMPDGDEEVKVTAERAPGATVTEEELCRWSIDQLPYFAVPLYVEFRESLPRSGTGKVLKEQLRREGKTPTTWDRDAAGVTFARR